jgi:hypothetical protein
MAYKTIDRQKIKSLAPGEFRFQKEVKQLHKELRKTIHDLKMQNHAVKVSEPTILSKHSL